MKTFSTKIARNTRLAYLAFAAVAFSQTGFAQVNDSQLTITGTVTSTSCYVKIAAGLGASGTGTGSTAATIVAPTVQVGTANTAAAAGTVLSPVVKFTVGLAAGLNTTACTGPSSWNTTFATSSPITTVTGRQFLPATGTGTGAAMELYSYSADGSTLTQTITSYPASGASVTYGANNISAQTGLVSVATSATQTFGVALVKTAGIGTALGAGTIVGTVTVNYALF